MCERVLLIPVQRDQDAARSALERWLPGVLKTAFRSTMILVKLYRLREGQSDGGDPLAADSRLALVLAQYAGIVELVT